MALTIDTYGGSGAVAEMQPQAQSNLDIGGIGMKGGTEPKPVTDANKELTELTAAADERTQAILEQKRIEEKEAAELKHAEEREDTAYQRALEDMRKAGYNTDGMNAQAAASAARLDTTRSEGERERKAQLERLQKELEVAITEGDKNRITQITTAIMGLIGSSVPKGIYKI